MAIEVERVSDEALEMAAEENSPSSGEAQALARLRLQRSKDRQVYAFRFGNYLIIGPIADARTELAMIEIAEEEDDYVTAPGHSATGICSPPQLSLPTTFEWLHRADATREAWHPRCKDRRPNGK